MTKRNLTNKPRKFVLPMRQVHLDFHTSPHIPDVGRDFNAKEFAATMKRAHVNSVTVFAKCHHGHLYYNTSRAERHPGLKKGLDLLGQQVEALHREGIRAPIYISIQCDEYAANTHPEWIAQSPDGTMVKRGGVFQASWQILDMSSPYLQYLVEQTTEVLKKFKPVDGIFFDMCWDQPSASKWAIEGMLKQGLRPESETDRAAYAHGVSLGYMRRLFDLVKSHTKDATVYFNSRDLATIEGDLPFLTQVEIEALPSGGWGYMYFPQHVRFVRQFDRPYLGMTARFHKSWADFGGLKPPAALEYETSQMIAHGGACSIGDQLHPRGRLDSAAYELIGGAYERVAVRERWLVDAKPVAEIGVLVGPKSQDIPIGDTEAGVTRMLTQLKHQFNFIAQQQSWDEYELVILPDSIFTTKTLSEKVARHLKKGKAILATGFSGVSMGLGTDVLLTSLGIKSEGASPFSTTYVRFGEEFKSIPASDHAMYDHSMRVIAAKSAKSLARIVEPYFERTWQHFSSHFQTPPAKLSEYSAAVLNGRTGYIAYPVFASYVQHANLPCRWLVAGMLDLLLPEPLVRIKAPSTTEVTVTRQDGRMIVHTLQYCPERRGKELDIIEDIVPIYDVELSVRVAKPSKVYRLTPGPQQLEFDYRDGRASTVIPEIRGHEMVVIEA